MFITHSYVSCSCKCSPVTPCKQELITTFFLKCHAAIFIITENGIFVDQVIAMNVFKFDLGTPRVLTTSLLLFVSSKISKITSAF